jgi:hypothetical protein
VGWRLYVEEGKKNGITDRKTNNLKGMMGL